MALRGSSLPAIPSKLCLGEMLGGKVFPIPSGPIQRDRVQLNREAVLFDDQLWSKQKSSRTIQDMILNYPYTHSWA